MTQKPRDAVVNFFYRNLRRHRAVLPAIARLLFTFILAVLLRQKLVTYAIWLSLFYLGYNEISLTLKMRNFCFCSEICLTCFLLSLCRNGNFRASGNTIAQLLYSIGQIMRVLILIVFGRETMDGEHQGSRRIERTHTEEDRTISFVPGQRRVEKLRH